MSAPTPRDGFPIGVGNDGWLGGLGVVELDGEFHVADVLGEFVDGVDEGPTVESGAEGVDGAQLGEGGRVEVGEDFPGDGAGLGNYVGDGSCWFPRS